MRTELFLCCGIPRRSAVKLEFLAMLILCPITVFAKFPSYNCVPYKNDASFSVCGKLSSSRREYKFGCDLFCLFGAEWNGTTMVLKKTVLLNNYSRWRTITTPKQNDVPPRLGYSSFAYVMAVFTPACLRESLLIFYDIVTKHPGKGTTLTYMEESDIEFWFSYIVAGSIYKYMPQPSGLDTSELDVQRWNLYWIRMLLAFTNEEINCT